MVARTNSILIIMLLLMAAVVVGCSGRSECGHFERVGSHGWAYADTIRLMPDTVALDSGLCDVAVIVRHTNGYEYSNLWIELTTVQSDSVCRDTFDIRLADEIGHWYGSGIGVGYQKVDTLLRNVAIDMTRPVMLRHIMRVDTLAGIEQLGLIITKE